MKVPWGKYDIFISNVLPHGKYDMEYKSCLLPRKQGSVVNITRIPLYMQWYMGIKT